MKRLVPFFVIEVVLFAGCSSKGDLKETTYGNGQLNERWYEKHLTPEKIVKVGKYESWCYNGKKETSGEYNEEGQQNGIWLTLNPNGDTVSFGEYLNGERNGRWISFDFDGRTEGQYQNGKQAGKWFQWTVGRSWDYSKEEEFVSDPRFSSGICRKLVVRRSQTVIFATEWSEPRFDSSTSSWNQVPTNQYVEQGDWFVRSAFIKAVLATSHLTMVDSLRNK
jgi:hypothetical protein